MKALLDARGSGLFTFEQDGVQSNLDNRRLNGYIQTHLCGEFTARDFRTWGGTLIAAIAFAKQGPPLMERPSTESQP